MAPRRSARHKSAAKTTRRAPADEPSADELHETAKGLLDSNVKYSIVTSKQQPAKRGRGRPKKVIAAKEDSSDFPEDSEEEERVTKQKKGGKKRQQVSEDEELEEDEIDEEEEDEELEEDDLSVEEDEEEDEDDEYDGDEEAPKRKRRGSKPHRLNVHEKVQRLKTDPRFHRIKPEVLGQVVEQFEKDPVTPSVIITASNVHPTNRRTRVRWTEEEEEYHDPVNITLLSFVGIFVLVLASMGSTGVPS